MPTTNINFRGPGVNFLETSVQQHFASLYAKQLTTLAAEKTASWTYGLVKEYDNLTTTTTAAPNVEYRDHYHDLDVSKFILKLLRQEEQPPA